MDQISSKKQFSQSSFILILSLSLLKLIIHLLTNGFASYGIFRDEFYYIACSNHLDLGYVDHPPLSIYILTVSRLLFGDSLFAIRLLPAISGAATVFVTGLMVKKLSGDKIAIIISSLSIISAPILLGMNTVYTMNSFDILLWTLGGYVLILIVKENKAKHWIFLGLIIGLGLLNKISMIWFAFGLFIALILTPQRKHLLTKWPYYTALIAVLLFLPFVLWNLMHDYAHLEFIRNATNLKYNTLTPKDFILGQFLLMHPNTIPVWLAGLYYYFFNREGKPFRLLGIIFITAFLILIINGHSKPEYLSPAYPMLFAAGGVMFEKISQRKYFVWLKYVFPVSLILGGIFTAPLALPCLTVESFIKYEQMTGISVKSPEGKEQSELPQFYADMFGWENMAKTLSDVYTSLPQDEKSSTVIVAGNYGEAGAVEYYSRKYELPPVISPHNNYWIWGWKYKDKNFQTFIIIGGRMEDHLHSVEKVEQAAIIKSKYCMPYENNRPVFIARKLKRTFEDVWRSDKHFE